MATSHRKQAILAGVGTEISGNAYTHESVTLTVTATMGNGSLLLENNTEAAKAASADVVSIVDDPKFDDGFYKVGETVFTRVAKRSVIANKDVIKFSDGAYADEALTELEAKGVILQAASTDFSLA